MTDSERLALLSRAVAPYPFMSVSSLELSMPRPSYTIDTLRRLAADHPRLFVPSTCRFRQYPRHTQVA